MFELLAILEGRKIKPFLFGFITTAELQQKLLHILAPRTRYRTELSSQSNRCSSDVSSLKSHTIHVLFMHLMYSNTVFKQPLEVQCIRVTLVLRVKENAEEVARCSSEVFLENCHFWCSLQNLLSVYCNF